MIKFTLKFIASAAILGTAAVGAAIGGKYAWNYYHSLPTTIADQEMVGDWRVTCKEGPIGNYLYASRGGVHLTFEDTVGAKPLDISGKNTAALDDKVDLFTYYDGRLTKTISRHGLDKTRFVADEEIKALEEADKQYNLLRTGLRDKAREKATGDLKTIMSNMK